MSLFKRISTTLRANVEQVVDQIENQDAVVEAAIREMKQANAKAKARLNRVREDRRKMEHRLQELKDAADQWQQRALTCAAKDEATAMECLSRRNQCREKQVGLEADLEQHIHNQSKLEQQIGQADERIRSLAQRRNMLRSRECNVEAQRIAGQWQACGPVDVDAVFERWEGRILEVEPLVEMDEPIDTLERQFRQTEEESALRAELQALVCEEKGHE